MSPYYAMLSPSPELYCRQACLVLGLDLSLARLRERDLLVSVLRGRDNEVLGICFEDEDAVGVLVLSRAGAADGAGDDDGHHPEHAQENTDTAAFTLCQHAPLTSRVFSGLTEDESDGAALQGPSIMSAR